MFFSLFPISSELLNLAVYCLQQFGMAFGVGAETIVLVAYLIAVRDGIIDEEEARFARAARAVTALGIFCILGSGAGITLVHYVHGQTALVLEPAFLFKWSLVGIVFLLRVFNRGSSFGDGLFEGFSGASWYALFLVHILAPAAGWGVLGFIYGTWLVGFVLLWTALVLVLRGNPSALATPARAKQERYPQAPTQSAYVPYQPMYAGANQAPSVFPSTPSVARAFSPAAPTPSASTVQVPDAPIPPAPKPTAVIPPPPPGTVGALKHIQVMPRSPDDIK